ncbi:MAG: hypothetical protein A2289_16125 [Deltaproteobacteria bacterium RIFOXYA12_FULL_58_15]|nr:MAG: hypothetical protein A2289_16125 [Deltaproteobacteria bacterium RIFOXYA12_FULL_58_15]
MVKVERRNAGAAAVEFALVLPLLMLLVLGCIDWGVYFFRAQVITNAAREGARAGSLEISDGGLAASAATDAVTTFLAAGLIDPAQAVIVATPGAGNIDVTVTYPGGSITGFAGTWIPHNILGRSVMRR